MTTQTASKGGLRAAAETKRTKAAQKTPLPDKAPTSCPMMGCRRSFDHKGKCGNEPAKPTRKELELADRAKREALIAEGQQRKRVRRATEDAVAKAPESVQETSEPVKRAPRKAADVQAAMVPESPPPVASEPTKADRYAAEMTKLGWVSEITNVNGLVDLVARRGGEAIFLQWNQGALLPFVNTYTIADRTVKIRNAAEAMRIAARQPEEAVSNHTKVASNTQFRKKPTGPTIRTIPFDPATATDQEIIDRLEARRISWHNQYRVGSETATVGRADKIQIYIHEKGHKILSFVDPEFGFRALNLAHLENVGRKVDLDRIKQQILASLIKAQKENGKGRAA